MTRPAPDQHDPFNTRRPDVHELTGWRWILFYPAALGLWLYFLTWRFRIDAPDRRILESTPGPRLVVSWHNRSLVMPQLLRRILDPSKLFCLISPSRMAAWEVAFFDLFGLRVVRGSTTRRSIQAAIEILRALRRGDDAGISPDGPSGPLYAFQKGAVTLARKAGVPLIILVPNCRAAWRLRTWDRHLVPLPFARIRIRIRAVMPDDPVWNQSDEAVSAQLRRVCLEMTEDPFTMNDHE